MLYHFRLVFPFVESDEVDYVTFTLPGNDLDEAIRNAADDLPWAADTILEVRNAAGESAHIVMGLDRAWRFVDVAHTIE